MPYGPYDTRDFLEEAGVNVALLQNLTATDRLTGEQATALLLSQLNAYNSEILGGVDAEGAEQAAARGSFAALAEWISYPNPQPRMGGWQGNVSSHESNEYGRRNSERIGKVGWLPTLYSAEFRIDFTSDSFEGMGAMTVADFNASMARQWQGHRNKKLNDLLMRPLYAAADLTITVGTETGKSVSWAKADEADELSWIPTDPYVHGLDSSTHTHLGRFEDTSDGFRAFCEWAHEDLYHHGYTTETNAPRLLFHSPKDNDLVKGDASYVPKSRVFESNRIVVGTATPVNLGPFQSIPQVHGIIEKEQLVCVELGHVPEHYMEVIKSFGRRDPRNPIRWWYPPSRGNLARILDLEMNPKTGRIPIEQATVKQEYGVGIDNREAGAVALFASSGSYVDPS